MFTRVTASEFYFEEKIHGGGSLCVDGTQTGCIHGYGINTFQRKKEFSPGKKKIEKIVAPK